MIYFFSKLFSHFFLPPGFFVTLFLSLSVVFRRCRKVLILLALFIWILSTKFFASLLLYPLENPYREHKEYSKAKYVVVLGGDLVENVPDFLLSNSALKRALLGYIKAKELNIPLIYTGGGNKRISEAEAFYKDMQKLFVKPAPLKESVEERGFYVVLEKESKDTYENAKLTRGLFGDLKETKPKIVLVTSAFHQKRATEIFKRFGFEPLPLACDFQTSGVERDLRDFLPSASGLKGSFIALKEYVGILSLIVREFD